MTLLAQQDPGLDRRANAGQLDPAALVRLATSAPLAWVVSPDAGPATLLPLIPRLNPEGEVDGFTGHFSARNPHVEHLRSRPEATLLFTGPNAFISSSRLSDRTLAPTWFYVAARFGVEITFVDDDRATRAHLAELVTTLESRAGSAWRTAEMGERFAGLARGVTAFQARVRSVARHFALGANEPPEVLDEMLDGLRADGRDELASWVEWLGRA